MTRSRPPLIGLTGRRLHGHQIPEVPAKLATALIDVHFCDYADEVAAVGGVPVQLTPAAAVPELVSRLDGLLLSGGSDIDPYRYGHEPIGALERIDPERDAFELALIEAAMADGLPILGICRGLQLLNVARGGTLIQHLEDSPDRRVHLFGAGPRWHLVHEVRTEPDSLARRLYGDSVRTTSSHHQAVDVTGAGLRVTGRAADGVIEILELPGHPVLGVQWHPEWHRDHDPAFAWLVDQAARRAAQPAAQEA
ncbi:MAG: gamma-glutamyl-gamma-aminobutyrate hydrolase family protein [Kineosporiaceae bacterium]